MTYFPEDIFKIIKEYNGIVGYFPKQLINILRYASADDLELILRNVIGLNPQFSHKQLSKERRIILIQTLFKHSSHAIFIKIIRQHHVIKDVHSYFNRDIQINQEALFIKGHNQFLCGIITKINHKSVKMKCYEFEIRNDTDIYGNVKSFKYWIKSRFYKDIVITDKIDNLYINRYNNDNLLIKENFIRIINYLH